MVATDQEVSFDEGVGRVVSELGWGTAGVPHSSFTTQPSAPGKLLHCSIFSLLSTLRGVCSGHYTSALHLVYVGLTSSDFVLAPGKTGGY